MPCTLSKEMVARAVDDAGQRLHDLRWEEWEDGGLAAGAFALAITASVVRRSSRSRFSSAGCTSPLARSSQSGDAGI